MTLKETRWPLSHANTCGQGLYDFPTPPTVLEILSAYGYTYSHSTNIGVLGKWALSHCFKNGLHNVSFYEGDDWQTKYTTSCNCWSGRSWVIHGEVGLEKHLRRKAKRYPDLKQK